jgi:TetR/AcrR family transcriptional regulator
MKASNSREKIIAAAVEIFAEKGRHGARMEEIAEKANINKAMLYYFYSTRENLFHEVLSQVSLDIFKRVIEGLEETVRQTDDPIEILKAIVKNHFDAYSYNKHYTKIFLETFVTDPLEVEKVLKSMKETDLVEKHRQGPEKMVQFLENGIGKGIFRNVNPKQIMISIIGMNMVYFAAQPISQMMLHRDVKDEKEFLKERQESIVDLLLYGIMNQRSA